MTSLDDLKSIKKYDRSKMIGTIESFPKQCQEAKNIGLAFNLPDTYKIQYSNIVSSGIGGSAIASDILKSCLSVDLKLPLFVNRNYILPAFVCESTLAIISSYSGNTEEMISAYRDAKCKKAKLIVVTSGGVLKKMAEYDSVPVISIPKGMPPRCATGYLFFPALILLSRLGFVKSCLRSIDETIKVLDCVRRDSAGFAVKRKRNAAKKIAEALYGRYPVFYASQDYMDCAVTRWRGNFAENAKTLSSGGTLPEMNHNEIMGWENPAPALRYFTAVFLKDSLDHKRISKRADITASILKKEGFKVLEVSSCGKSRLARIFSMIYMGDFVSFYLSMLNRIDPTPISRIENLKKALIQ
jgi:glucose/mannose-6-phosphate isomerase